MARMSLGQGRLARLGIGAQVALTGALALAAVLMLNWLAARPGVRQRFDLTAEDQNSLSTATTGVLERLPGEVTVDVFFRDEPGPLRRVAESAMARTQRLLGLYRDLSNGKVRLRANDMGDTALIDQRRRDLRLRGIENCLVLSHGDAREVLTLNGDLATFDPGRPPPNYESARIKEYRGERAITGGLLEVTRGEELHVYFTTGHGELEIPDTGQAGLDSLVGLLQDEGLRVHRWNPLEDGPLPEDCACLSVLNPADRLADDTLDQIETHVRRGGRLVVAPHSGDERLRNSGLNDLLRRFDLEVQEGIVCQFRRDPNTNQPVTGDGTVAFFPINPANMARHSLVEPFRAAGRTFVMHMAHPVRVLAQPQGGLSAPLFTSEVASWVDTDLDFTPQEGVERMGSKFDLAIASQFPPAEAEEAGALEENPQARIVLVGGAYAFTNSIYQHNADFLRNLYNWALDREYRISMSPRDPDLRLWPQGRLENLPSFNQIAWGWLPGLCLLLGILFAVLRARGGPRRSSSTS